MEPSSRAITPRTKMIIVNTPHNPVGKVFTKKELESIAALAQEFNLIVMSDEVVGDNRATESHTSHLVPCSMTVLSSTGENIIVLPICLACGTEP